MPFTYPAPRRSDQVDDYHGTPVADPYRWMEDPDDPETRAFVAAENEVTMPYLGSLPEVEELRGRIAELWNTPRTGAPSSKSGVTVWQHNDGISDQPVFLISRDGSDPEVLLDPNGLSDDGAVAVMVWALSPDGGLLAYTLSEAGSDRQIARIRDTATGEDLPDELRHLRFTNIAWWGEGFFYSRFPDLPAGDPGLFENMTVHYHRIGTPQERGCPRLRQSRQPDAGIHARGQRRRCLPGAHRDRRDLPGERPALQAPGRSRRRVHPHRPRRGWRPTSSWRIPTGAS